MMQAPVLKTEQYLNSSEIKEHLKDVEFIIMATPAPEVFKETPIQFSIFLNTEDNLPKEIQKEVLEKLLHENNISKPAELMSQLMPVGFSIGASQETPMPLLLVDPKDQKSIPYNVMFVMDFLADSETYEEVKEKSLTGWSYTYN